MKFGWVITYYRSSNLSLEHLKKLVDILSVENFYVVLASHSPIPIEIQEKCDYVIFEKMNMVDAREFSHGVPENRAIKSAFEHLKQEGIEWAYKTCYDVVINDIHYFKKWIKNFRFNFVTCQWGEIELATHSFFANVDFLLTFIPTYNTIDEMFADSNVLEIAWKMSIEKKGLSYQIFTYPNKEDFFGTNKMDTIALSYNKLKTFHPENEEKFYISNETNQPFTGNIFLFDYFTDTCMYFSKNVKIDPGICLWLIPGPKFYNKNGTYFELFPENSDMKITRYMNIKNYTEKYEYHKKLSGFKYDQVKINEYHELIEGKIYEKINLKEKLKDVKVILDVGANFGLASFEFALDPTKKVYMIDADPRNISILNKIFGHYGNVKIIPNAISSKNEELNFYSFKNNSNVSSLLINEDIQNYNVIKVKSISPDILFEQYIQEKIIDYLKIDIEGGEYDFFESISDFNLQKIKKILIEFHNNTNYQVLKIIEKLAKNNFTYEYFDWGDIPHEEYSLDNKMGIIYAECI